MAIYELSDIERYTLQEACRRDDDNDMRELDRNRVTGAAGNSPISREFRKEAMALVERRGGAVLSDFLPRMWVTMGPGPGAPLRWVLTTLPGESLS